MSEGESQQGLGTRRTTTKEMKEFEKRSKRTTCGGEEKPFDQEEE